MRRAAATPAVRDHEFSPSVHPDPEPLPAFSAFSRAGGAARSTRRVAAPHPCNNVCNIGCSASSKGPPPHLWYGSVQPCAAGGGKRAGQMVKIPAVSLRLQTQLDSTAHAPQLCSQLQYMPQCPPNKITVLEEYKVLQRVWQLPSGVECTTQLVAACAQSAIRV